MPGDRYSHPGIAGRKTNAYWEAKERALALIHEEVDPPKQRTLIASLYRSAINGKSVKAAELLMKYVFGQVPTQVQVDVSGDLDHHVIHWPAGWEPPLILEHDPTELPGAEPTRGGHTPPDGRQTLLPLPVPSALPEQE